MSSHSLSCTLRQSRWPDEFDSEGNIISLKAAPAQAVSQPTLPTKMADNIDEEGNIISPLGSFKQLLRIVPVVSVSQPIAIPAKCELHTPVKIAEIFDSEGNIVSLKIVKAVSQPSAVPAETPRPAPAQTPHTSPPLATQGRKPSVNTTMLSDDRHVWKQRATRREMAAAPKTGGVKLPRSEPVMLRDNSVPEQLRVKSEPKKPHVRILPWTKPCDTSPVITPQLNVFIQNILAKERKEMKQIFDEKYRNEVKQLREDLKCRCSDKLVFSDDHVPTNHLSSVTADEKNDDVSKNRSAIAPLASGRITLLAQLSSENIEQVLKLQTTDKDKQIASKIIEIKKLKMRIASLVHENNVDHLERQQSMTSYSSSEHSVSDSMSISNQSVSSQSSISSYKEFVCVQL